VVAESVLVKQQLIRPGVVHGSCNRSPWLSGFP
jgi:hypothetical protein